MMIDTYRPDLIPALSEESQASARKKGMETQKTVIR